MMLNINAQTPAWWIEKELQENTGISKWWDGLEWQAYEVPEPGCLGGNMTKEMICALDVGQHTVLEWFGGEWLYKMIGNAGVSVREGIESEITDILGTIIIGM